MTKYMIGNRGGAEQIMLTMAELPAHNHEVQATNAIGTEASPSGALLAAIENADGDLYSGDVSSTVSLAQTGAAGSQQSHPNMQPFLTVQFIIAIQGVYPVRN